MSRFAALSALFAVLLLPACDAGHRHQDLANTTVERSVGKGGAAVSLRDGALYRLSGAGAETLSLRLDSGYDAGEMTVTLTPGRGLLMNDMPAMHFDLAAGEYYEIPVSLDAMPAGRYYLHLHCRVRVDGRETARVLSAIVQVGEPDGMAAQKTMDPGPVVLPAEEMILHEQE